MRLGRPAEARVNYQGAIELFTDGEKTGRGESTLGVGVGAMHELAVLVAEAGEHGDALRLFEIAALYAQEYSDISQRPTLQAAIHRDWAKLLRRTDRDAEAAEHEARAAELSANAAEARDA